MLCMFLTFSLGCCLCKYMITESYNGDTELLTTITLLFEGKYKCNGWVTFHTAMILSAFVARSHFDPTSSCPAVLPSVIFIHSPRNHNKIVPQHYHHCSICHNSCSHVMLTRSESVYTCNFAICTNEYRLQCIDTKALRNTTECNVYNASNKIT